MPLKQTIFKRRSFSLLLGEHLLELGHETKIMGVLNITPDSFSDGGKYLDPAMAECRAIQMQDEGAHWIDLGGESTRPGSKPVSSREEIRRIRPVLRRLVSKVSVPISIDTYKYDVAAMALDEGASAVNDIYGLRGHARLAKLVARYKAGLVLMHMQGRPHTMQKTPRYKNILKEVVGYLKKAVDVALAAGVKAQSLVVDPGFGFGKSFEHNLELLSELNGLGDAGFPMLVGISRKSFIGTILNASVGDRLYGSLAASGVAVGQGAHLLRVHDVAAHRKFTIVLDRLNNKGI